MKLSVYFVVKNEIQNLPNAIKHTRSFADEIVVVDTGSDDGTREWLEWLSHKVNCFVIHSEQDQEKYDASRARNIALKACSGDWVLALDGDEFIAQSDGNKLKHRILELSRFDALSLPVFNFLEHPKYKKEPYYLNGSAIRIFKNNGRFKYENCIHPELKGYESIGHIKDVAINHYQFLEADFIEEKTAFRIKQMARKIKEQGYNFLNYLHLADIFRRNYYWTGDKKALRKAIIFLEKTLKFKETKSIKQMCANMKLQYKGLQNG